MKGILIFAILLSCFNDIYAQGKTTDSKLEESEKFFALGEYALSQENYDDAISNFETALEKNPEHLRSYVGLAAVYWYTDEFVQSVHFADKGLALFQKHGSQVASDYLDLIKVRAFSSVAIRNFDQAIEDLSKAIELDEENYYLHYKKAVALMEIKNIDEAFSNIQVAYELNSSDSEVLLVYGMISFHRSEYDKSIDFLKKSIRIDTFDPAAYYFLGMSYYFKLDERNAIDKLEAFLNHPSQDLRLPVQIAEAEFRLGLMYNNRENWLKVIPLMMRSIEIDSLCQACYYALSVAYMATDNLAKAENVIEASLTMFPGEGGFQLNKGWLMHAKEDIDKSRGHYKKAFDLGVKAASDTTSFYRALSKRALAVGDTALALKSLDRLIGFFPGNSSSYIERIDIYMLNEQQYRHEIIADLGSLAEVYSRNKEKSAFYFASRAVIYGNDFQFEEAIAELNTAIQLDPYPEYFALRAFYTFSKEVQVAQNLDSLEPLNRVSARILKDVDTALQSKHRRVDTYLLKTTILLVLEKHKEACEAVNKAIELGADISKEHLKFICKAKPPKDENSEWVFFYYMSTYGERFLK